MLSLLMLCVYCTHVYGHELNQCLGTVTSPNARRHEPYDWTHGTLAPRRDSLEGASGSASSGSTGGQPAARTVLTAPWDRWTGLARRRGPPCSATRHTLVFPISLSAFSTVALHPPPSPSVLLRHRRLQRRLSFFSPCLEPPANVARVSSSPSSGDTLHSGLVARCARSSVLCPFPPSSARDRRS